MLSKNRFLGDAEAKQLLEQGRHAELRESQRCAKLAALRAALASPGADDGVQIEGNLDLVSREHVEGWAWTPSLPDHRCDVSVWLGNDFLASGNASGYREDLEKAGKGDGCHQYKLFYPAQLPVDADLSAIEVKVEGTRLVLCRH